MSESAVTASQMGLCTCHGCGSLTQLLPGVHDMRCRRCGAALHLRKPNSISRTWAFLIASYILYVPANVLPIMHTGSLFGSQSDTIMSGIVYLWHSGSWHLALIVFIASILVPLAKILSLTYLVISVQLGWTERALERTKLYRVLEFVGPWSMLDVYVVTILVALVQLKSLATIQPGPAAAAFGAVVVLTMFAAMAFDPRLLWEPKERHHV
ncbi:MAG TPA: paraquat-inducible protein A [Nitrospiraceae bacterium]|nr:paraquat-inducible protein A [Nitrospiraceae bacterium]